MNQPNDEHEAPMNSPEYDSPQPVSMAQLADPHLLYQKSVQSPELDMPFLTEYFEGYTHAPLRHFREDFCGTAFLFSHFVTRKPTIMPCV